MRTLIRGGRVVLGRGDEPAPVDVLIEGGTIAAIGGCGEAGAESGGPADEVVDAQGRLVLPGLIDAHSHLDAMVFDEDAQLATLAQGVTTVVAGQDGVSFAPGSGEYGSDYFGPLNGAHPTYRGGGVAQLLAGYDGTSPINVAYLVPLGTVRHEVMGFDHARPGPTALAQMQQLVAQGLDEGAVGVSSGLDYVPGIHADADELAAMCRVASDRDAVYVTHMRGGYEERSRIGTDEIAAIVADSGVRAHISHYHGEPALLTGLIDELGRGGAEVTYDSYFYLRGFSLTAMPTLPAALLSGERRAVAASLRDPSVRGTLLRDWFASFGDRSPLGAGWANQMTIAHAPTRAEVEGLTLAEAAALAGQPVPEFVLDLLADTQLWATTVMQPMTTRSTDDMVPLLTHEAMVGGSDGIAIGAHPHPRAFGNFARYLRELVVDRDAWTWGDAAWHLAEHTARIMRIDGPGGRGRLAAGMAADVVLVDPSEVRDLATYDDPRRHAAGVDDVWVNGVHVLRGGRLTGAQSGVGVRRRTS